MIVIVINECLFSIQICRIFPFFPKGHPPYPFQSILWRDSPVSLFVRFPETFHSFCSPIFPKKLEKPPPIALLFFGEIEKKIGCNSPADDVEKAHFLSHHSRRSIARRCSPLSSCSRSLSLISVRWAVSRSTWHNETWLVRTTRCWRFATIRPRGITSMWRWVWGTIRVIISRRFTSKTPRSQLRWSYHFLITSLSLSDRRPLCSQHHWSCRNRWRLPDTI